MTNLTGAHLDGLDQALAAIGRTHTVEDVMGAVDRGEAQLWLEGENALVTELNITPLEKELHIWLATGSLEGTIALSERAIAWGRSMGCTVATLVGREGWKRTLRGAGWSPVATLMARRLDG